MPTNPTKRQPARRTPAADAKLPYPELPETEDRFFWLAALFCDLAEIQALDMLITECHQRKRSNVVLIALYGARGHLRDNLKTAQGYVLKEGLLPFAFAGTTVFGARQAAA